MILGIGGVSRAGKSTLSRLLSEGLQSKGLSSHILHQDEYPQEVSRIPLIQNKTNWEVPESINFERILKDVEHHRQSVDVLIVEGLFAFYPAELRRAYDKSIFIHIDKDLFRARKETDFRWGAEKEPDWYIEHIWDSYLLHGKSSIPKNTLFVQGSERFDIPKILDHILES